MITSGCVRCLTAFYANHRRSAQDALQTFFCGTVTLPSLSQLVQCHQYQQACYVPLLSIARSVPRNTVAYSMFRLRTACAQQWADSPFLSVRVKIQQPHLAVVLLKYSRSDSQILSALLCGKQYMPPCVRKMVWPVRRSCLPCRNWCNIIIIITTS
jgi:hypothetical protein